MNQLIVPRKLRARGACRSCACENRRFHSTLITLLGLARARLWLTPRKQSVSGALFCLRSSTEPS